MAMRLGEKAERVLKLLLGLRNPRVASALASCGFTDADLQEGWSLLQAVGGTKLAILPLGARDKNTIEKLDLWENRWFPIASASLARRHPAVHARLFLNLSQTEGPEVAISVQTFLNRYDAMSRGEEPYGAEGEKAKALLTTRGLTAQVVDEKAKPSPRGIHWISQPNFISAVLLNRGAP